MEESRLKKHGKKLPLILHQLKQVTKKEKESAERKSFPSKKKTALYKKVKTEKL